MVRLPAKLEGQDVREAGRLSRSHFGWVLPLLLHREVLLVGGAAVVLTISNLTRQTHESWGVLALLWGLTLGAWGARRGWVHWRTERKAKHLNDGLLWMDVSESGVERVLLDGSPYRSSWSSFTEVRAGKRVLMLFYKDSRSWRMRTRYYVLPIHELSRDERLELFHAVPVPMRSAAMQSEVQQWR